MLPSKSQNPLPFTEPKDSTNDSPPLDSTLIQTNPPHILSFESKRQHDPPRYVKSPPAVPLASQLSD